MGGRYALPQRYARQSMAGVGRWKSISVRLANDASICRQFRVSALRQEPAIDICAIVESQLATTAQPALVGVCELSGQLDSAPLGHGRGEWANHLASPTVPNALYGTRHLRVGRTRLHALQPNGQYQPAA